jgi:hypothetical protein
VQLGTALIAGAQPPQVVQPGEGALHHPALFAEPRAVLDAASGDHWLHATAPQLAAVLVVVVTAVGEQPLGTPSRAPSLAGDGADAVDQRQQLGDVVAVPAGQADRQRNPARVGDQVVLGAPSGTVHRRGAGVEPPKRARMWLPSSTAADQSIRPAAFRARNSS